VRRLKLEAELGEIEARLHASKSDQRESERERRSAEAVQKLMRIYPAVHGRMVDLCKPTKAIYRTALTVAMGKNMDAVVVDDEKTAIECIQYLKEQKYAPETFIPLDSVRVRPARDALRQLGKSYLPVQDVVATQDERFKPAIFFAVGDTIVCDSWQEARQLAFQSGAGERYKVVTKDGTLINKAGLITGGSSQSDKEREKKWDRAPQSRKDLKEHDELKKVIAS
jgi:structural maintenance of chromosome 1